MEYLNYRAKQASHLDFYTSKCKVTFYICQLVLVELNDELTAIDGQSILDQVAYIRTIIQYIISLNPRPKQHVILVGHSMGGVVARIVAEQTSSVKFVYALGSPLVVPVLPLDSLLVSLYRCSSSPSSFKVFALSAGPRDFQIPNDLTLFPQHSSSDQYFSSVCPSLPFVWSSDIGHQDLLSQKHVIESVIDMISNLDIDTRQRWTGANNIGADEGSFLEELSFPSRLVQYVHIQDTELPYLSLLQARSKPFMMVHMTLQDEATIDTDMIIGHQCLLLFCKQVSIDDRSITLRSILLSYPYALQLNPVKNREFFSSIAFKRLGYEVLMLCSREVPFMYHEQRVSLFRDQLSVSLSEFLKWIPSFIIHYPRYYLHPPAASFLLISSSRNAFTSSIAEWVPYSNQWQKITIKKYCRYTMSIDHMDARFVAIRAKVSPFESGFIHCKWTYGDQPARHYHIPSSLSGDWHSFSLSIDSFHDVFHLNGKQKVKIEIIAIGDHEHPELTILFATDWPRSIFIPFRRYWLYILSTLPFALTTICLGLDEASFKHCLDVLFYRGYLYMFIILYVLHKVYCSVVKVSKSNPWWLPRPFPFWCTFPFWLLASFGVCTAVWYTFELAQMVLIKVPGLILYGIITYVKDHVQQKGIHTYLYKLLVVLTALGCFVLPFPWSVLTIFSLSLYRLFVFYIISRLTHDDDDHYLFNVQRYVLILLIYPLAHHLPMLPVWYFNYRHKYPMMPAYRRLTTTVPLFICSLLPSVLMTTREGKSVYCLALLSLCSVVTAFFGFYHAHIIVWMTPLVLLIFAMSTKRGHLALARISSLVMLKSSQSPQHFEWP